jgi:Domain of unknown function (DUF4412)
MKLNMAILFVLIASMFVFSDKVSAQENFEGKVSFNVFDNGNMHSMDYYMKDGKICFDANEKEGRGQFIMDPSSKKIMIIMPDQKMYMEMEMPVAKINAETQKEIDKGAEFSKTGETKEILGHDAEKWIYKNGDDQGEAWLTKDIGSFIWFNNPMMNDASKPQWMKDLKEGGYFPLMVTENGKKVFEVTGIEKKSLDESLFEPPAGFKKMDIPNMQK